MKKHAQCIFIHNNETEETKIRSIYNYELIKVYDIHHIYTIRITIMLVNQCSSDSFRCQSSLLTKIKEKIVFYAIN